MTGGRSIAQTAAGVVPQPDGADDLRASAGLPASGKLSSPGVPAASDAPEPRFAMLGDPGAAACEGDSCTLP